jgi:hypothetical protein
VVEHANGKIFTHIKKRLLEDKKGNWADQLPKVLWGLNTMESRATGSTPFRLMYGAKAMTPQKLRNVSPQSDPDTFLDIDEMTTKDLLDGNRV